MPREGTASPWNQSYASWGAGLYLYCVADSPDRTSLGRIGLGGTAVYTIPFREVCAVVHRCSARPYGSRNLEVVRKWALTHQRVVDTARRRWGTVLPSALNTVFQGRDDSDVGQAVREWLAVEYHNLRACFQSLGVCVKAPAIEGFPPSLRQAQCRL